MTNTSTKKLSLQRETLRTLDSDALDGAVGGKGITDALTILVKKFNDTVFRDKGNPPVNDTVYRGGGKIQPL